MDEDLDDRGVAEISDGIIKRVLLSLEAKINLGLKLTKNQADFVMRARKEATADSLAQARKDMWDRLTPANRRIVREALADIIESKEADFELVEPRSIEPPEPSS